MKLGTVGFAGARLREAREARGITAAGLAELLGVSRQAVSQYEAGNGSSSPSPETMQRIASVLNFPVAFFCRPAAAPLEEGPVFYRSMSAATKTARTRAEARIGWMREILTVIREYVDFPPLNLPALTIPDDIVRMSEADIETAAGDTRKHWGLGYGPIPNVVRLLEKNGLIVCRINLDADTLDAFSTWIAGSAVMILGADKGSAARSKFDAGHELGHLILHRNVANKALSRKTDFKLIEEQAHRFASAFLLPAQSFARDVYAPSLDTFRSLKQKWGVSIGMMIKRAQSLNLISEDQARYLWIGYSKRGWRLREPLDDEMAPEQPQLLRASLELMVNQGVFTREDLMASLPYSQNDLEDLLGLPSGYLAGEVPQVRYLGPSLREAPRRQTAGESATKVVPFPGRQR